MSTSYTENLDSWMTVLPEPLKDIPIIHLAIPGSHDSMSYGIRPLAPVAPDATDTVQTLNKFIPCVVRRWAVTQKYCVTKQLTSGIRYFDLRFSLKPNDSKYYFVHGLYCEEITKPLEEMRKYLDEHENEIVILDCQHFYNFEGKDFVKIQEYLLKIFDGKIYGPPDGELHTCSLNVLNSKRKQILVIYRYGGNVCGQFWQSWQWPTPWPNTISITKLQSFLDDALTKRPEGVGYVSQCVLTPSTSFIVPRFLSSLRRTCAKPVNKKLSKWIAEQTPGPYDSGDQPRCNVFLADFIEIKNSNFCKLVVDLNSKIVCQTNKD